MGTGGFQPRHLLARRWHCHGAAAPDLIDRQPSTTPPAGQSVALLWSCSPWVMGQAVSNHCHLLAWTRHCRRATSHGERQFPTMPSPGREWQLQLSTLRTGSFPNLMPLDHPQVSIDRKIPTGVPTAARISQGNRLRTHLQQDDSATQHTSGHRALWGKLPSPQKRRTRPFPGTRASAP